MSCRECKFPFPRSVFVCLFLPFAANLRVPFSLFFSFFFCKPAMDPEGTDLVDSDGDNEAIAEICTADDAARLQQPYSTYLRVDARRVGVIKVKAAVGHIL